MRTKARSKRLLLSGGKQGRKGGKGVREEDGREGEGRREGKREEGRKERREKAGAVTCAPHPHSVETAGRDWTILELTSQLAYLT